MMVDISASRCQDINFSRHFWKRRYFGHRTSDNKSDQFSVEGLKSAEFAETGFVPTPTKCQRTLWNVNAYKSHQILKKVKKGLIQMSKVEPITIFALKLKKCHKRGSGISRLSCEKLQPNFYCEILRDLLHVLALLFIRLLEIFWKFRQICSYKVLSMSNKEFPVCLV